MSIATELAKLGDRMEADRQNVTQDLEEVTDRLAVVYQDLVKLRRYADRHLPWVRCLFWLVMALFAVELIHVWRTW